MPYTFTSSFGLWGGEIEKKEWVGDSLKTIVLTAAKYIASCYCSQCGHMAECLWALQFKDTIIKYCFLLPNKLIFDKVCIVRK